MGKQIDRQKDKQIGGHGWTYINNVCGDFSLICSSSLIYELLINPSSL